MSALRLTRMKLVSMKSGMFTAITFSRTYQGIPGILGTIVRVIDYTWNSEYWFSRILGTIWRCL